MLGWVVILLGSRPTVLAQPPAPIVIAAGVPKYLGETRDYDRIFAELSEAGVTAFLSTTQYQEVPTTLALGTEVDFLPPCEPTSPAFAAMRKYGVKLIVPGQLFYGTDEFPALDDDPLRALMECAGEGMIFAVLSIDEPVNAIRNPDDPAQDVRALYERVKLIAPDLPVMMVHAPLPTEITEPDGSVRPPTLAEIDHYLSLAQDLSRYADMIGFDLYPIPPELAPIFAPGQGSSPVDYPTAFPGYLEWLNQTASGRPVFMVLQGFSYERLLDAATAQQAADAGYALRFPTPDELRQMVCLTYADQGMIVWWGQSHLIEDDAEFWGSVLDASRNVTTDPGAYCD
jgi:hypothetical protein